MGVLSQQEKHPFQSVPAEPRNSRHVLRAGAANARCLPCFGESLATRGSIVSIGGLPLLPKSLLQHVLHGLHQSEPPFGRGPASAVPELEEKLQRKSSLYGPLGDRDSLHGAGPFLHSNCDTAVSGQKRNSVLSALPGENFQQGSCVDCSGLCRSSGHLNVLVCSHFAQAHDDVVSREDLCAAESGENDRADHGQLPRSVSSLSCAPFYLY